MDESKQHHDKGVKEVFEGYLPYDKIKTLIYNMYTLICNI
jgi:hypothetical protein